MVASVSRAGGCVVWFTGLSGAGKSTLAGAAGAALAGAGYAVELLDAEAVRPYLTGDLGFSRAEREEGIRRIARVADLLARHGVLALVAAMAPYRAIRREIRGGSARYFEVYVNAPLEVCERRDPKGLYRRARAGEVRDFIGVDEPHEPPESADLECRSAEASVEDCARVVVERLERFLAARGVARPIPPG